MEKMEYMKNVYSLLIRLGNEIFNLYNLVNNLNFKNKIKIKNKKFIKII